MSQYSYVSKIAVAATLVAPAIAEADVIRVSGQQIHLIADMHRAGAMTAAWDVDGDGQADGTVVALASLLLFNNTDGSNLNFFDKSFRNPPFHLTMPVFATSDRIGPSVAANYSRESGVFAHVNTGSTGNGIITTFARLEGDLIFGHNFIGFELNIDGERHFGFAEMELAKLSTNGAPAGLSLKITRWAYEDEPDAAIHVEPIPAPPAAVGALTLLCMGAAGLRGWRGRQEKPGAKEAGN